MVVLKIGGSLFDHSRVLLRRVADEGLDVLVVPGGGGFADMVRKVSDSGTLSNDAAHWMAVLAMNQYAYYMADTTGIHLTETIQGSGTRIALPYEILRNNDVLPHSWDVTSDTIAAWMAREAGTRRLIKATDVDGIFIDGRLIESVDASNLHAEKTCMDQAMPGFLIKHKMDVFIVNGLCPPRVISAIKGHKASGTWVRGK
ncbi:MAG TPA: amino acid kinase [Methanocella sp.]|nr:amino acid kinase [Methanocella sp.]